ncbi:hypothetical protein GGX14DRAFT_485189 [Mycena pura]|uniref:Uncharacterized protein n=1 Tax=Mycena pura TaxID=153505 RepID=A0AAD6XXB7_9AGAR|nr:hypothetical protein GGX14DRAFT_485189 [Mycena pura]
MEAKAIQLTKSIDDVPYKDYGKYDQLLAEIEAFDIDLNEAYPWPTYLSELLNAAHRKLHSSTADDPFAFGPRRGQLIKKWDRLQVRAVGNAWSRRFPRLGHAAPLPVEMVSAIASNHVADTHSTPQKMWREQTDFLINFALVCKTWTRVAREMLYRGCIRLYSPVSVENLHRTLSSDIPGPRPILDLIMGPFIYPSKTVQLLTLCTSLEVLEISSADLDYSKGGFPDDFVHLHELRLSGVNLRMLASLITRCPNLRTLRVDDFQNFSGRPRPFRSGGPPHGDSFSDIPQPCYNLRELYLKDGMLTEEQALWLFSSSSGTLERASLRGIYSPALPSILKSSVKFLQLEEAEMNNAPLAATLREYTSLEALCLVGSDWPWASLFTGMTQPLRELSISWSPAGFAALEQHSGRPSIRSISTFFRDPAVERLAEVEAHPIARQLKDICTAGAVMLHWFSIPESSVLPMTPFQFDWT